MPFVAWHTRSVKRGARLGRLVGVNEVFRLLDGESVVETFPRDAAFHFDPDFKRDTQPVDCFLTVERLLVCSQRLRAFIEARAPEHVEYLPVTVFDHAGTPLVGPFFVVHPTDPPDCIDFQKSIVTWSASDPTSLLDVEHLEIDATKVPSGRLLFRARSLRSLFLLRANFALDLERAGFTGAGWLELE